MARGLMLGSENSEFQVIVFVPYTQNDNSENFLSQPNLSTQKFVWFLSKPRVNKDFSNSVKYALSEFRVIVFWYRAINDNSINKFALANFDRGQ